MGAGEREGEKERADKKWYACAQDGHWFVKVVETPFHTLQKGAECPSQRCPLPLHAVGK